MSAALTGLLIIAHASIDLKNTLLGKHHYLLFWLAVAMQPRMCMLLDDKLEPIKTQVRVGTAVDTVGQVTAPPLASAAVDDVWCRLESPRQSPASRHTPLLCCCISSSAPSSHQR